MDEAAVERLSSFEPDMRRKALAELLEGRPGFPPSGTNVNLHYHSFFSYNACHYSPIRIAWEARRAGLYAAAICDFDALDGLAEFCEAGLDLSLRTSVHLETRTFVRSYAAREINSPGEPGVAYIMGAGFGFLPLGSESDYLDFLKKNAADRNRGLIERINRKMPEISLDYAADVLPLTPAGVATERHIVSAYTRRAAEAFPSEEALISFWSGVLGRRREETEDLMGNGLEELVRARLVKRGGWGYQQPGPGTFPPVEDFLRWVTSCRAIPMVAWLDGTSAGEEDPHELLGDFRAMGAAALNIIPDRNWNLTDSAERRLKLGKLREIIEAAETLHFPINIGTEMNKAGLPFADDLGGRTLAPFREVFLRGARILTGHSLLLRYARVSYVDDNGKIPEGLVRKNSFFESVGALPALDRQTAGSLEEAGWERALGRITESARVGRWIL